MTSILVVDQDVDFADLVGDGLRRRGYQVASVRSATEALSHLERAPVDIVVAHVHLSEVSGLELVARLRDRQSEVLGIVVTSQGSMETAVGAIRAGAYDFISKPLTLATLEVAIQRAVTYQALRREVLRLRIEVAAVQPIAAIVGDSPAIREVTSLVHRVADSPATVLITGESGTGKELVARAIHDAGPRKDGPFVALNCAAMPAQLLESELFGHEKGAFTDARTAKPGLFIAASGGTIFLDEIGELPLEMQPKLLRALQEHAVRAVGGTTEVAFDARVIAATNRNLETMIEERTFREDLYFRINVLQVDLPPLRSRGGDVLVLARHFLDRIAARAQKRIIGFSPEAAQKLMSYSWPGNVRELENCIERAVALASFDQLAVGDLPEKVRAFRSSQLVLNSDDASTLVTLEELEQRYVVRVLESVAGNKAAAARILGIERKTLYRMLERWGERTPQE